MSWPDDRDPREVTRALAPDTVGLPRALALALERYWTSLPEDDEEGWGPRNGAPRPAPRHVFEAAAARLDSAIPSWVVALWSCRVRMAGFADVSRRDLGAHIVDTTARARAAGAPETACFVAVHVNVFYGFDAAPVGAPNLSDVVRAHPTAKDPARRVTRVTPLEYLRQLDRVDLEAWVGPGAPPLPDRPKGTLRIHWEDVTTPPGVAPIPQADSSAANEHVVHPKFGRGVVVERSGQGADEKVVVDFDEGGRKTLLSPSRSRSERPLPRPALVETQRPRRGPPAWVRAKRSRYPLLRAAVRPSGAYASFW